MSSHLAPGPALLALAIASGCSSTPQAVEARPEPVRASTAPLVATSPFPPASAPMELPLHDEGWTLGELVALYADTIDETVNVDEVWQERLAEERVGLDRAVTVPPASVHSFVEAMLVTNGYVLERPWADRGALLVTVPDSDRPDDGGNRLRARCLQVPAEGIERFLAHPALLVSTVVEMPAGFEWADSRRGSLYLDVVPVAGTSMLLVMGTGERVAREVRLLRDLARAELTDEHTPDEGAQ